MIVSLPARPTSIRIDEDTLAFVDLKAAERGCSRSFLIELVLKAWRKTVEKHVPGCDREKEG